MVTLKSLFILGALSVEALAVGSQVSCSTKLGPNSIRSVPTSTTTQKETVTIIKRIIRKVNVVVVPVAKTTTFKTTSTVTSTTAADADTATATDTITSAITVTSTRSITEIVTSIKTTTTTKFITSTVPAPAGFTAVLDDPHYIAKRAASKASKPQDIENSIDQYPQRVDCLRKIPTTSTKIVSTTIQGARTTLKPAIKTKMSTVVVTEISTEYPADVSTTVISTVYPTETAWTDTTTTQTVTQTVTIETQVPDEPVYAACYSNNILLSANNGGRVVRWVDVVRDNNPTLMGGGYTATRCCAECAKRPTCRLSLLDTLTSCYIYLATDATICANGQQPRFGGYLTSKNSPLEPQWIYSNGACGQYTNGGDIAGYDL